MTEETTTEAPYTNQQIAENTVKELSANDLTKEFQRLLDEVEYYKKDTKLAKERATQATSRYSNLFTSISDFIIEHVKEEQVQIDDLKELAEELNIKLTKSIKVTFNVKCEYEFDVPLDWTDDDIDESDFDICISSNITDEEVEETSESMQVEDFEVQDND
jgi:2-oxoglutarate dehydrogenase complex dehydrogenase (E1) component-like enzyme